MGTTSSFSPLPTLTGTSGVSKLESEVLGLKIIIECVKDTFTGTFEAGGASKGEVKFKECSVINPETKEPVKHCSVHEPIEFKFRDQLLSPGDEFKPFSGTTFVEITFEGEKCAIKGTYKVEGTQTCNLPNETVLQEEHEIECLPAGSGLTFAGKPAHFTSTEKVKLESGGNWAME